MAGLASKRQREEAQIEENRMSEGEELKRQKSYNQIVSLLEEEEEEAIEDLSSIITTLQQEISSPSPSSSSSSSSSSLECHPNQNKAQPQAPTTADQYSASSSVTSPKSMKELEEEGERERTMRHLLEASDDELGIPNGDFLVGEGVDVDGVGFSLCDAFWEMEDEAANYYTLFQSQLFM